MAELTLTEAVNGARISVCVGDVINICLPENSAAGYRWTVSSLDHTRLAVEDLGYQSTSDAVGSAGTATWRLSVKLAGRTRVELKKSRPWEPAAGERFAVELDITG